MEFREALVAWAMQQRRRDRGEPFERERVIEAVRTIYTTIREFGTKIDPALPVSAVLQSGVYNLETATDDDYLRLAEDMYQESKPSPEY